MSEASKTTAKTSAASPRAGAGVPLLDLRRQYATIREEVQAAIGHVCETQHLVMGEEVAKFEREVAQFTGAADTVSCASGTDALWLALQASGIGPGDSVITTPFSFFASASTIVRCGARPVFVDVEPSTLNLDPEQVLRRVKLRGDGSLRAIMPVHLYGQCARIDQFQDIAAEHKLTIVEDAAQAYGAAWRGKRAGSLGNAAGFSFYPTKNLSAFGDGGCVTTSDPELAARMRRLRNHGSDRRYYHEEMGWNSRLDALQAAVLRVKMKHIQQWNERRRQVADLYDRLFEEAGLSHGRPLPGEVPLANPAAPVRLLSTAGEAYHIFHQYVVRVPKRDELRQFLADRKIGAEIYYPVPLHLQKCFAYLGYGQGDLPEAEQAAKDVLALPVFPELTEDEQRTVVQAIAQFYS
ncbi:MAG TPA: DegT/DnrJ/EryC1/StrS family aminotransferase [Clostridia bacterium]|nr:DegT/DnrJ/EryC1/StrS family aminotransferase [Clostridia bacterium]